MVNKKIYTHHTNNHSTATIMPPKKRKRPSDQTEESSSHSSFISEDGLDAPPFLNTTFTTYRASPLHVGTNPLTQDRMNVLSQRLRDILVGDVVRGVEVGLDRAADDAAVRRAGALETVVLGWVRLESLAGRYVGSRQDGAEGDVSGVSPASTASSGPGASPGKRHALQITLQYENAECAALLLPAIRPAGDGQDGETASRADLRDASSASLFGSAAAAAGTAGAKAGLLHLPLLLLRMPAPLRTVIIDFISRTFDCRITPLSLGTRSLVGALERWMGDSQVPSKGAFAKDVVLSLGFYGPTVVQHQREKHEEVLRQRQVDDEDTDGPKMPDTAVGIKSIDIIVPNQDLRRFLRAGRTSEARGNATSDRGSEHQNPDTRDVFGRATRRRLGGDKDEEAWTWRRWESSSKQTAGPDQDGVQAQPFIEALAQYVRKNLALDMFHPAVRVIKVACGGFALSEGRVKIFGVAPNSNGESSVTEAMQRAIWAVLEGLVGRAQLQIPDWTLSGSETPDTRVPLSI